MIIGMEIKFKSWPHYFQPSLFKYEMSFIVIFLTVPDIKILK
jgi:hypothetical protein